MTYSALAIDQASWVRARTSSTGRPWSAPAVAVGVGDHRDDVPHVEALREHDFLAGPVLHLDRRQRIAQRLHDLVLEVLRVVDVQQPRDARGAREDVVADPRVRIALDLV